MHSCLTLDAMTSADILDIAREKFKLQLQLGTSLLHASAETLTVSQPKIKAKHIGSEGDHINNHYVQIHMEEIMVMIFYTNMVFFLAGEVIVSMPYLLRNSQLVD